MAAKDSSFVTIISGLPRSGTSMMMQMVAAGGMKVLTDQVREADDDNLKGYFEFEPVKATKQDNSWVKQAVGKAVKAIYAFLIDLPPEYEYRVIFMRRPLQEAMRSQQKMLQRLGQKGATADPEQLASIFERQLAKTERWLAEQHNFRCLDMHYSHVIQDPLAAANAICEFLDTPLDTQAMSAAVDPSLYRQRRLDTGKE